MKNALRRIAKELSLVKSAQPLEFYGGLIFLAGLALIIPLIFLAPHAVSGENAWIKPAKFFFSTALYVWTMGWIQLNLPRLKPDTSIWKNQLSWWIVGGMAIENMIITLQATRGVQSHFNQTSVLDIVLYAIMGVFAVAQIPAAFVILRKFMKMETKSNLILGIELGLMAFILGGFEGVYLSAQRGHTVGATDGGAGLPLVNWSLQHGDLRIAHFVLLHGLQILPLLAIMLGQHPRSPLILKVSFAAIVAISVGFFIQAFLGYSVASLF